jgi:hypothetical protein
VLHTHREERSGRVDRRFGEVTINAKATIFKKIKHGIKTRKAA